MSNNEVLFVRTSRNKNSMSTEGDSSTNEDDIWDDALLIKAYDKAVQLAQQNIVKSRENVENEVKSKDKKRPVAHRWKVGDRVKCQYSEDYQFYEAEVVEIIGTTGMCIVKYVGYENEERVPLKKLKPSDGECARNKQCKEAIEDIAEPHGHPEVDHSVGGSAGKSTHSVAKKTNSNPKKEKHFKKRNGYSETNPKVSNTSNFPPPQLDNPVMPPPPPPHVFNRLTDDENESEAMSAMLMSWYMSGYHTGYYQGLKMAKKQ